MTTKHHGTIDLSTILPSSTLEDHTLAGYAWVITEDRINDTDSSRVGTLGPRNAPDELCELVQKTGPHRIRFRMYDDDGNYYYGGFLSYDPDRTDDVEPTWAPVEDFGMPDAGAVRISYPDAPHLDCA